jgi:hypothetical protein
MKLPELPPFEHQPRKYSGPSADPWAQTIFLLITFATITISFGAGQSEMQSKTEEAQKKFTTTAGHDYVEKFATGAAAKRLIDAMHACDKPAFPWNLSHDIVFVVGTDGRVERVLQSPNNPFGDCITSKHRNTFQNRQANIGRFRFTL